MAATTYVGETILLSHTATFDGEDLTSANTNSVEIIIYDPSDEVTVSSTPMIWSSGDTRWEYWWDTDGLTAGKYTCKVTVTTDTSVNWEFFKITLKANPI